MPITQPAILAATRRLLALIARRLESNAVEAGANEQQTELRAARRSPERQDRLPRVSRHAWGRPDLARMLRTEDEYAPYVSPLPPLRRCKAR